MKATELTKLRVIVESMGRATTDGISLYIEGRAWEMIEIVRHYNLIRKEILDLIYPTKEN